MVEKNNGMANGMSFGFGIGVGLCAGLTLGYFSCRIVQGRGLTATQPCPGNDNYLSRNVKFNPNLPMRYTGVYLGKSYTGPGSPIIKPLSQDGHVLVIGQTGSGKTASIVNPTMETAGAGFNLYLDVKGELAKRHRKLYGANPMKKLFVFNPFDSGQSNCYYDPFSPMKREPEFLPDYALQLAKALIPVQPSDYSPVWAESAIAYTAGVIIDSFHAGLSFIETMERINTSTVSETVKSIVAGGNPTARFFVSKFMDMDPKTIAGIGMELTNNLSSFAASEAFRNAFGSPQEEASQEKALLDWNDLNAGEPFDVILVFPEDKLNVLSPIYRTMVSQLVTSLARRERRTYNSAELPPVLVVLDEMTQLGRISVLEHALATLRCRGVTMVLLIQSLAGLEAVYGKVSARSIMENCEYKVILGSTDVESQRYLAQLVGTVPVRHTGTNIGVSLLLGASLNISRSYSEGRENVIQPHAFHLLKDAVLYTPNGVFLIKKHPVFGGDSVFGKPWEVWS